MTTIRNCFLFAALMATATLASSLLPGALSTSGTARAANWDQYQCFTDDGYGRKRPCSAGYKAANPTWRAGDSCFSSANRNSEAIRAWAYWT